MKPLVYIILVNYNGYSDTLECVNSLLKIKYSNYKILIVDNASKDAPLLKKDKFLNRNAEIIYASDNLGFSDGNNIGIKYAMNFNPDYILLLNNDTIVDFDFLNTLVETAEKVPEAGIVTGKIYYNGSSNLWYCGGEYNRKTGFTNQVIYDEYERNIKDISFASGCLMLISRDCILNTGFLCDDFFMYSEDTDYCCRVLDKGYRILFNPESVIYHKVSASAGNNTPFQQYYLIRNNLIMIKRHGTKRVLAYLNRTFQCLKDILKGRSGVRPIIWAYSDFLKDKSGKSERF